MWYETQQRRVWVQSQCTKGSGQPWRWRGERAPGARLGKWGRQGASRERTKIYKGMLITQHGKFKRTFKYFSKARLRFEREGQLREGKPTSFRLSTSNRLSFPKMPYCELEFYRVRGKNINTMWQFLLFIVSMIRINVSKKLLHSKGNHQQYEKATYWMKENIYKSCIW